MATIECAAERDRRREPNAGAEHAATAALSWQAASAGSPEQSDSLRRPSGSDDELRRQGGEISLNPPGRRSPKGQQRKASAPRATGPRLSNQLLLVRTDAFPAR
jgi:hypothetical protein